MLRPRFVVHALGILAIVFIITIVSGVKDFWNTRGTDVTEEEIVVEEGDALVSIIPQLQEKLGVKPFWIKVYARVSKDCFVQPGTFWIPKNASYANICVALEGYYGNEVTLTIPEGFSLAQIGVRVLATFPDITQSEWDVMTGINSPLEAHPFVMAAEKPRDVDLEGYLFPDTYRFFADATAEQIVNTMLDEMQEKYEQVAKEHETEMLFSSFFMTVHQRLTLASIVEKEVRQPDTRATVAGIFTNRLIIGMPLQSDATINYIIDGDDPSPTLADLEVDSLYNTYQHAGLPPGPIASPGLSALTATLNPTDTDYMYFLTTDEGAIYYAETHDEHVANKMRYLR